MSKDGCRSATFFLSVYEVKIMLLEIFVEKVFTFFS